MKLQLPAGDFRAFIFDCDGTLADTMPLHYQAWRRVFQQYEFDLNQNLYYSLGGVPARELVPLLNARYSLAMPVEEVVHAKEIAYLDLASFAKPIRQVTAIVEEYAAHMPMAVASGGGRASVRRTLEAIGLLSQFEIIIASEDVTRGKPDPEPFLTAAARLGVEPSRCLVFEDAEPGVAAAQAAGMAWVRIPHTGSAEFTDAVKAYQ